MNVLVTGASGAVGGLVARQLMETEDIKVTALVRDPGKSHFPEAINVAKGDLSSAQTCTEALRQTDVLFLLLTYDGDPAVIDIAKEAGVKKIVGLQDGTVYPIEKRLRESKIPMVILYPVEFMKNALNYWKDSIRYEGVARTPFPDAKGAQIHERDIADAAVTVITEDGHEGKEYHLTGAEAITPRQKIETIAKVMNRPIHLEIQTEEQARADYASWGFTPDLIEYAIRTSRDPEPWMYQVLRQWNSLPGIRPEPLKNGSATIRMISVNLQKREYHAFENQLLTLQEGQ